jgi:hypothetical protein
MGSVRGSQLVISDRQYVTHLPPLCRALSNTAGPVLEVGMGHGSTPFLSLYCWVVDRRLVSVDSDQEWVAKFRDLPYGEKRVIDYDRDLPELAEETWSVVLVDHWPGHVRGTHAQLFSRTAEIVLVHDWDKLQHHLAPLLANWRSASITYDTLILTR